jgi:hypothetical protein
MAEVVEQTRLAQDKDKWWDLVNTIMNLWVPYKKGNFLTD